MTKIQLYYELSKIQIFCTQIMTATNRQNYGMINKKIQVLIEHFTIILSDVLENLDYFNREGYGIDAVEIENMLSMLIQAQDNQDYILLADLLEIQIIPFVRLLQEIIRNTQVIIPDNSIWENNIYELKKCNLQLANILESYKVKYESNTKHNLSNHIIEPTNSGQWTLAGWDDGKKYYYHSNVFPMEKSQMLAEYYYDKDISQYVVWGIGIGYHIQRLAILDRGISIKVYESNLEVLYYSFLIMEWAVFMQEGMLEFVYDPTLEKFRLFTESFNDAEQVLIIHNPSIRHIENKKIRQSMEQLAIRDSEKRSALILLNSNFKDNIKNYTQYVDLLKPHFAGKKVVIIAAGPSLDKNIAQLKEKSDNVIILAVETVFRKLLQSGIAVDYVIVTDPNKSVYRHIEGLEDQDIPMLYLSTAWRGFSRNYKGKRYLICQKDFDKAEELASQKGWNTYSTGGSVSTTALDVCVRLGCDSIAFVGLDLAYTNNMAHSKDCMDLKGTVQTEDMKMVPAIGGGTVPTSKVFLSVNRWIENRVKQNDVIMPIYDATEGGAIIEGLKVTSLYQYLQEGAE